MDRLGIGLVGAVALGTAAGIIIAPESGRRVFAARTRREVNRVAAFAREQSAILLDSLPELTEAVERGFIAAAAALTQKLRTVNP
ncbi:MAG TPA: YtxH domain-containing protein, partial [Candidatus Eremiobacteraceae bacterium]